MQLVNLLETTRNQQLDKIIVQSDKMNIVWKLGLIVVSLGFAFFVENKFKMIEIALHEIMVLSYYHNS